MCCLLCIVIRKYFVGSKLHRKTPYRCLAVFDFSRPVSGLQGRSFFSPIGIASSLAVLQYPVLSSLTQSSVMRHPPPVDVGNDLKPLRHVDLPRVYSWCSSSTSPSSCFFCDLHLMLFERDPWVRLLNSFAWMVS
jgi:hypothetical protein